MRAMMMVAKTLVYASLLASGANAFAGSQDWVIKKTEWSETDERNFGAFVAAIADSGCRTVDSCLKSPANPYRGTDSPSASFFSDCGRFPYLMRTYFAWKNGLPFGVVNGIAPVEGLGHDIRYSPKGNLVTSRLEIVQSSASKPINGPNAIDRVMNSLSTGVYRYNAERDDSSSGKFFDFVPAPITRDGIHPGTTLYDPNGHAAIVYRIEPDGRIRFVDAHPGNYVTRSEYGAEFVRASPNSGSGFKNFRPIKLTGATRLADGTYVGGHITAPQMSSLPLFSMEQFYGTNPTPDKNWKKASFVKNGQKLDFYDYVRTVLAIGDLKYQPIDEMVNEITSICSDLQDRIFAVDDAVQHGIADKSQPYALPDNIYGTSGEWEAYSTPSRDARLKTRFVEVRKNVQRFVELYRAGSPRVVYTGTNLVQDLRDNYEKTANACIVQYKRTDNTVVELNYSHIALRLFSLSFDPYQCIERRWGATDAQELATCKDGGTKQAWYQAEQPLRNQLDRTYDIKMGFTLDQLNRHVPGSGVATPPDDDLRGYLYSL